MNQVQPGQLDLQDHVVNLAQEVHLEKWDHRAHQDQVGQVAQVAPGEHQVSEETQELEVNQALMDHRDDQVKGAKLDQLDLQDSLVDLAQLDLLDKEANLDSGELPAKQALQEHPDPEVGPTPCINGS